MFFFRNSMFLLYHLKPFLVQLREPLTKLHAIFDLKKTEPPPEEDGSLGLEYEKTKEHYTLDEPLRTAPIQDSFLRPFTDRLESNQILRGYGVRQYLLSFECFRRIIHAVPMDFPEKQYRRVI